MFSERLKQTRKLKCLKQKDVAQYLCLDRSTYAGYESGKNKPSFEKLIELADLLNVSVDYLLGRSDNPILLNITYEIEDDFDLYELTIAEDLSVFDKYVTMDKDDKKAVSEFIEARILLRESGKGK
ncbi:MAG: helix-turn-helix domain-containing protein [Eubacteriales bacterium]